MILLSPIRRWLEEIPIAEPLRRRHAVTLQIFVFAFSIGAASLEVARVWSQHRLLPTTAINGINVAVALTAAYWLRKGLYQRAATLLVVGFGTVSLLAFAVGGLQFSRDAFKTFALVLTLAALLLGRRALWTALAAFGAAMSIAWARDLGYLGGSGPRWPTSSPSGVFWSTAIAFGILAIVLDRFGLAVQEALSDRERAETALRNSEELFRVAFQTTPNSIGISRLDDGVVIAVNEGFTLLTGWPRSDALGRSAAEMGMWVDPAARERVLEILRRDGALRDFETRFQRRDGSVFIGSVTAQRFDLGGLPHQLTLTRDVTADRAAESERALLQAQLLQSQKLDSIGRVAGGVAHDLNNMLTAVLGYTDLLEVGLATERQRADLAQIRLGGQRAAGLTRQLLSFARKQPIAPRDLDLNALIANLGGLLRRLVGEQIEFVVRDCPGGGWVRADAGQLEQVLLNLVVNARDAMPGGGRLVIETSALPAAEMAAERVPGLAAEDHLVVAVSDTGSGMTADVVEHLFEPFFTTKEPGKGTGLGLATCYGIVQQAGGRIGVTTRLAKGSTFRIYLPRLRGVHATAPEASPGAVRGGSETVLLVEDEPQLRALASRVLREHGYRVLEASDGVQGLEVAAAYARTIDLLLTDVVMPRLGGQALADKLRAARPAVRVLFASGYSDSPDRLVAQGNSLLQKPFTASALLQHVRQSLDV